MTRTIEIDGEEYETDAPEGRAIQPDNSLTHVIRRRKATGGSDNWSTPDSTFLPLHAEFNFDVDICADPSNHRLPVWMGPGSDLGEDALAYTWNLSPEVQGHYGVTVGFCNPPHSLQDKLFAKAHGEALAGRATTVFLCPVRPDTARWHKYVWDKDAWRTLPGVQTLDHGLIRCRMARGEWRRGVEVRLLPGRIRFLEDGVPAKDQATFPSMILIFRAGEVQPCG